MAGRHLADPAAPQVGTVDPRREARQVALRVDRRAGVADRMAAAVAFSSINAGLFTFAAGGAKASPPLLGAWHRAWLMLVPILGWPRPGPELTTSEGSTHAVI
jgi:hypothetical protein